MGEAFHQGGWGMYPTAIVGLVLLGCAVDFARNPDRGRRELVRVLSMLTFIVGALGFVTGCIKSFTSLEAGPDATTTALIGVGESLNNIGLALCMLVLGGVITAVGTARGKGAELADPHA